jgi:hypothetical protein
MRWERTQMIVAVAALAAAGCDRLTLSPPKASSEPTREAPAAPAVSSAALRAAEGSTYATFVSDAGARYAPETLGLAAVDRARLWRAMAAPEAARLLSGGGAEALVFRGCSEAGCEEGRAVVAVDTSTGSVFAAVRDVGGADVLAANDRIEALLRLNSPSRRWDDPAPTPRTP